MTDLISSNPRHVPQSGQVSPAAAAETTSLKMSDAVFVNVVRDPFLFVNDAPPPVKRALQRGGCICVLLDEGCTTTPRKDGISIHTH